MHQSFGAYRRRGEDGRCHALERKRLERVCVWMHARSCALTTRTCRYVLIRGAPITFSLHTQCEHACAACTRVVACAGSSLHTQCEHARTHTTSLLSHSPFSPLLPLFSPLSLFSLISPLQRRGLCCKPGDAVGRAASGARCVPGLAGSGATPVESLPHGAVITAARWDGRRRGASARCRAGRRQPDV